MPQSPGIAHGRQRKDLGSRLEECLSGACELSSTSAAPRHVQGFSQRFGAARHGVVFHRAEAEIVVQYDITMSHRGERFMST